MPDTAASAAAVNQSPGVPIVPEQWGETTAPPYRTHRFIRGVSIKYPGSPADLSVGEGECPTRRRVPPQLIQSHGVPIDKVNGVKYPTF